MRIRTGAALLVLAGATALAAGCAGGHTSDKAKPAAVPAAVTSQRTATLVAAAQPLRTTSYRFEVTAGGVTAQGSADPATRTVVMDTAMSIKLMVVDGQFYLKYPKGAPGADVVGTDKWLHIDTAKFSSDKLGLQDPSDPAGASGYLKSASSVQQVDATHYKGTLDLTKAGVSPKMLDSLGDSARAVPFAASVDGQGRLSTLDTTTKVDGSDVTSHMTFSDYGTPVTATKPPASQVTEATDRLYRLLNH